MDTFSATTPYRLVSPRSGTLGKTFLSWLKRLFVKHLTQTTEHNQDHDADKAPHLNVAQYTDVGRRRTHNEDNMAHIIPQDVEIMARKGALFIVADGMGGQAAGEIASELAVTTVCQAYYQDDTPDVAISLVRSIQHANVIIYQRAMENAFQYGGMGTTCVSAVVHGTTAYIANVGDSRAYLVRQGQIRQISHDHSWVAEQVRAGIITEEQAQEHRMRSVITRSLGSYANVEVDLFTEHLEEEDTLILCSDGLSGSVSPDEIQRIVEDYKPQESVYYLVERANAQGGSDNITAIVIRFSLL